MLTLPNGVKLPASLVAKFDLILTPVTHPAAVTWACIGEPCLYCQTEGNVIEVNAYGATVDGDGRVVESCAGCTEQALFRAGASCTHPVTLEYAA